MCWQPSTNTATKPNHVAIFCLVDYNRFLTRIFVGLISEKFNDWLPPPLHRQKKQTQTKTTMKSTLNAIIISLVLISRAFAASPTSLTVKSAEKINVYNIHYRTTEKGTVKLSIIDSKNNAVYSEVLFNTSSFVRPFNFSQLNEGEYTIVLEDKNGKQSEKISYTVNQVTSFVSVSPVANQDGKYRLNVYNNGSENVDVRIYAHDGKLVHDQILNVNGNYALIYNLKQVTSPAFTFEVTTSNGNVKTVKF